MPFTTADLGNFLSDGDASFRLLTNLDETNDMHDRVKSYFNGYHSDSKILEMITVASYSHIPLSAIVGSQYFVPVFLVL